MAQNYTLRLNLRQANIIRTALQDRLKSLQKTIESLAPNDGTTLKSEYLIVEALINDM